MLFHCLSILWMIIPFTTSRIVCTKFLPELFTSQTFRFLSSSDSCVRSTSDWKARFLEESLNCGLSTCDENRNETQFHFKFLVVVNRWRTLFNDLQPFFLCHHHSQRLSLSLSFERAKHPPLSCRIVNGSRPASFLKRYKKSLLFHALHTHTHTVYFLLSVHSFSWFCCNVIFCGHRDQIFSIFSDSARYQLQKSTKSIMSGLDLLICCQQSLLQ